MAGVLDITLERDGHDQPWGFRLQGGHDVGMPLSVQRILVGTPSEGVLKKGDILLRISKTDAKNLSHQQAADLFTNTGNQITIQVKRTGVAQKSANAASSVAPPQPVPISGGIPLPGMTTISAAAKGRDTLQLNLPKTLTGAKPHSSTIQHSTSTPLSLTIQNQPYRTSPLIQPSVKVELGPGSSQHLKMQADYLTGNKEVQPPMDSRAIEFTMKQKVAGTLQHLQYQQPSPPVVGVSSEPRFKPSAPVSGHRVSPAPLMQSQASGKQVYNNPINLYSQENVAEVAKLNQMGMSGAPASPTGLLHPNKIQQVVLSPPKDYNPKDSATWQALQESDPTIVDPEKLKNFTSLREHDPIYAEVYDAAKVHRQKSASPQPASMRGAQSNATGSHSSNTLGEDSSHLLHPRRSPAPSPARSPVADLLPASFGGKATEERNEQSSSEPQQSAVLAAALKESNPVDPNTPLVDLEGLPLYETNSIGGRRKIAQSTTFNKLMMNVLGE